MRPLSSSPNKSNTWTMCSLPMCRGLWRGVHKCARLCFGCAQFVHVCRFRLCTVCTVCRMFVEPLTAVFSECFASCAHICRMCRTLSQNSTRLGNKSTDRRSVRVSGKKQLRTGFQPVEQKRNRRQIRELFPSGAVRGRIWPDLAKSGAPAAILINAYSGDFCHPVLSNALAQEPLVYHSGTRELFSDIFGTFSEISTFSTLFDKFWRSNLQIRVQTCKKTHFTNAHTFAKEFSQMRTHLQKHFYDMLANFSAHATKHKRANLQMCEKCVVHKMRKSAAQIIFPNAEITNLHCAQKHKCNFLHMSQIYKCK